MEKRGIDIFFKEKLKKLSSLRVLVVVVFILCDVIGLIQPYILGKIIDVLSGTKGDIFLLFGISLFILIISFILNYTQNYYWFKMIYKGESISREAIFKEVLHQKFSFFKTYTSGDILNRILNDSAKYAESKLIIVPMFILNISTLVIVFFFLFLMNTKLALAVFIMSFVYFIYYGFLNRKLTAFSKKERESFSKVMDEAASTLAGKETINLDRAEDFFVKRFATKTDNHFDYMMKLQKWKSLGVTGTSFLLEAIPLLIVFVGAYLVIKGETTVGVVFSFYTYIGNLNQPINNLTDANLTLQSAKALKNRIQEMLQSETEEGYKIIDHISSFGFNGVDFAYDDKPIIDSLSFDVNGGDKVFVSGPSGAGKSTLIKLILKQLSPDKGKITVNGLDLSDLETDNYYKHLAIMPQDVFIFDSGKIESITFGHDYPEEIIRRIVDIDFIKNIPDENVQNCSGGEKQRIALARAIIKNADILILDEPTSALDKDLAQKIVYLLGDITFKDKIFFIVSHNNELSSVCNKAIVFSDKGCRFVDNKNV